MKVLNKNKLVDFMGMRKAVLDDQVTRDFSGGIWARVAEQREVKYWKEAIERGEFDTELQEIYVILSATSPEIADFTYYDDLESVIKRVEDLNEMARKEEYWYITLYSNIRNGGKIMDKMTPTGFHACPQCGNPTVIKGQYCSVECAIEASKPVK
jgi:hypothetical protein